MKKSELNTKNGIASLLQLEAISSMDTYLYQVNKVNTKDLNDESNESNDEEMKSTTDCSRLFYPPSDTPQPHGIFEASYFRHTLFDKESFMIEHMYHQFDTTIRFEIESSMCDAIGDLTLKIVLPNIVPFEHKWTNSIAHALIEHIKIKNGDEELVTYTGEYLHLLFLLNTPRTKYTAACVMYGHHHSRFSCNGNAQDIYIHIPFFKEEYEKYFFPLITANKQTVIIEVKYSPLYRLLYVDDEQDVSIKLNINKEDVRVNVQQNNEAVTSDVRMKTFLLFDGYHLHQEERLLFLNNPSEYIFKQITTRTFIGRRDEKIINCYLDFKDTISDLIIVVKPIYKLIENKQFEYMPIDAFTFIFDGNVTNNFKMSASKYLFMNTFIGCPQEWVYCVPFGLSSNTFQPTGSYTFTGKQGKNVLVIHRNDTIQSECMITIYGISYNYLMVNDGLSKLKLL